MNDYAASEIRRALASGPAEGEDFYRMKVGSSRWFNVSHEQAERIAEMLADEGER